MSATWISPSHPACWIHAGLWSFFFLSASNPYPTHGVKHRVFLNILVVILGVAQIFHGQPWTEFLFLLNRTAPLCCFAFLACPPLLFCSESSHLASLSISFFPRVLVAQRLWGSKYLLKLWSNRGNDFTAQPVTENGTWDVVLRSTLCVLKTEMLLKETPLLLPRWSQSPFPYPLAPNSQLLFITETTFCGSLCPPS